MRAAEDHSRVESLTRPHSNRQARRARTRRLRVVWLALALILANTLAPWSVAFAGAHASHVATTAHHCHDAAGAKPPIHGNACPCCDGGCQCLHTAAAPLPAFLTLRPPAPASTRAARDWLVPPAPPFAEHLRPPIA